MFVCAISFLSSFRLVRGVGQERYVACALDGFGQHALVRSASPTDATRQDFPALRDEALKQLHVLVINEVNLLAAKAADLTTVHASATTAPASVATVAVAISATAAPSAATTTAALIEAAIHII
jgi:hypothetical protein